MIRVQLYLNDAFELTYEAKHLPRIGETLLINDRTYKCTDISWLIDECTTSYLSLVNVYADLKELDLKSAQVMQTEWQAESDEYCDENDCGIWATGINIDDWGRRIVCYGITRENAITLRNQIMALVKQVEKK